MHCIETDRLLLRPFRSDDLDAYHRYIHNDPLVTRFLPTGMPIPREATRRILLGHQQIWQHHDYGVWALVFSEHRKLIGHCGLQPLPGSDETELIIAAAQDYWGRGLATEAAQAGLRYGFEVARLDEIVAVTSEENRSARRVLEKLGMTYRGLKPYYHTQMCYYTLARRDFVPMAGTYIIEAR